MPTRWTAAVRSTAGGAFYTKSTTLYNEEGGSADVSIVGAEDDARMTEYFTFRTRVGHDPIPFEEDSVILTEKNGPESGAERGRYVLWRQQTGAACRWC